VLPTRVAASPIMTIIRVVVVRVSLDSATSTSAASIIRSANREILNDSKLSFAERFP
jgi:hypothetical protein